MKSILCSIFILLAISSTSAQQYHPLVDSGNTWNVEMFTYESGSYDYWGSKLFLEGDTSIQGFNCKILKFQSVYNYHYSWPVGFPPRIWGVNYQSEINSLGALREDSNRKVFAILFTTSPWETLFPIVTNTWMPLYDFNLEVGDTFFFDQASFVIANAIDSVQILNGEWRKRISFNSILWEGDNWMEGIGSEGGVLGPYMDLFEGVLSLRCFRKNDLLIYEASQGFYAPLLTCDSVDIQTGIEDPDFSNMKFQIVPNPASDFLTVNFATPDFSSAQLKITNILGQVLLTDELENGKPFQIPVSEFNGNNIIICQPWRDGMFLDVKKILVVKP
ncbi:MAG: hypothetical protein ABI729_04985 [Chitinophagales bacterium]